METMISAKNTVSAASDEDRRLTYAVYVLLLLVIIFSTYLHHFQPQVFSVPDNKNIEAWQRPSFEQTTIHDRMTAEEKERTRLVGIPMAGDMSYLITNELIMLLLSWWCFRHARKHYGFWMASCFFIGSFVFTGLEESAWILSGRYLGGTMSLAPGGTIYGTYWFTKGFGWFVETPVSACLGWFIYAYSCVWIAGRVFPKLSLLTRATVGGLTAMLIDMWQDPVLTSPELMNWVWGKADWLLIFGIPLYNFVGWFLLIFLFAIFWEKLPQIVRKYGQHQATIIFLLVCTVGSVIVAAAIFLICFGIAGTLASLAGVQQTLHIPPGW
ncbi:MAG: carotenoid biosynthesis protein [Deltaproteobacteria bacterium]|nr:carotenoid biosynthesis protein [Deltaproteobacteria bacterium]